MKWLKVSCASLIVVVCGVLQFGCGSGGGGGSGDSGGCPWNTNCGGKAPNGGYDCRGDELVHCVDGVWKDVVSCGSTHTSKGYSCTCKGGCGVDTTVCSYAFNTCESQSYDTCGPNAKPVITDAWRCE